MSVGSGRPLSSTHHRRDAARIAVEKMKAPAALSPSHPRELSASSKEAVGEGGGKGVLARRL